MTLSEENTAHSEYNENFASRFSRRRGRRGRRRGRRGEKLRMWGRFNDGKDSKLPDGDFSTEERHKGVIQGIDLLKKDNGLLHFTSDYEILDCVVRRGQAFNVKVALTRSLKSDESIQLRLQTDSQEMAAGGPNDTTKLLKSPVDYFSESATWQYRVEEGGDGGNVLMLEVMSPSNAIICCYSVTVLVKSSDGDNIDSEQSNRKLYVIFNPWLPADDVYMKSEDERKEYVLNEDGVIFVGSSYRPFARDWEFGQFDDVVLEVAMDLLDKAGLSPSARRSAVLVSRAISKLVNAEDDDGILIGNWSGDYSGGSAPSSWTGSVDIIQQYADSNYKPVAYGQCWVFSGLVTTVMRALGVPCRSVTNFDSAHDTDHNCVKDVWYDESMERIDHNDSLWNFHVWNEVYMRRPDLPVGYNGWQVIDATPQETSDSVYQLGPCSLASILEGNVHLPYDGHFVFAEVNADEVHAQWRDNEWHIIRVVQDSVGSAVLTKAVHSDSKHDITALYKNKDGTPEERLAVMNAVSHGNTPYLYINKENPEQDVRLYVSCKDHINLIADNFTFTIFVVNHGSQNRTVTTRIIVKKTQYTGMCSKVIHKKLVTERLAPGEEKEYEEMVQLGNVLKGANDDSSIKIQVHSHSKETGQLTVGSIILPIELPVVEVTSKASTVKVGETVYVELKVPNPFDITLTQAFFELAGAGLAKPIKLGISNVKPNEVAGTSTSIVPIRSGPHRVLHATFSCKQFQGSRGSLAFKVE